MVKPQEANTSKSLAGPLQAPRIMYENNQAHLWEMLQIIILVSYHGLNKWYYWDVFAAIFLIDICGSDPPVGAIVQVLELVIDVTATNLPQQAHDIAVIKEEEMVSSSNTLDDTPHQTQPWHWNNLS